MPKHPLPQSLGSCTHPVYQGATHDVVYRGPDDEETRNALFEMLTNRRGPQIVGLVKQYRNEGHDVTNALMKAHLGDDMFEVYKSGKPTTEASPFTNMLGSLVGIFSTRGNESDGVEGEKSHISQDSNGRFFYKGKGYDVSVSVPENWRKTVLSKVDDALTKMDQNVHIEPYLKITPKNDELAHRLADDFNKSDNLSEKNMVKLAQVSIECATHGCSEIAFVHWDATMNMQSVFTTLQGFYRLETPDVIESGEAITNGNTFTYGNATFKITRNDATGMRITPTGMANAEEFVDKLLNDWNAEVNDDAGELVIVNWSKCAAPWESCIDVGFKRQTMPSVDLGIFKMGNYGEYNDIQTVMDKMVNKYAPDGNRRGTHDLFDKFHSMIEPVPPSVEHHTTYDGGIGPLGNVLAEM